MSKKKVALAASAALAASTVLIAVQPAQAAVRSNCVGGVIGAVTIPGDLVINRNVACVLEGTTVQGSVKADGGSDVLLDGATVNGEVYAARNAYVEILASTVTGQVRGRDAYGILAEGSIIGGQVQQTKPNSGADIPFVYLFSTDVAGGLTSTAGEVILESAQVGGAVSSRNGAYTDVLDSVIGAGLTVRNNADGSVVCESEIYGASTFRDNDGTLQIGGGGEFGACEGASFWGGTVTFTGNTVGDTGFDISNNIVSGDLTGGGNDPLPTGTGNRVRGTVTLPFAAVEDAAASQQLSRSAEVQAEAVAESRSAAVRAKIEQRRGAAVAEAEAAPEGSALVTTP